MQTGAATAGRRRFARTFHSASVACEVPEATPAAGPAPTVAQAARVKRANRPGRPCGVVDTPGGLEGKMVLERLEVRVML